MTNKKEKLLEKFLKGVENITLTVEPSWTLSIFAIIALPFAAVAAVAWAVIRRLLDNIGLIALSGSIIYLSTILALAAGIPA